MSGLPKLKPGYPDYVDDPDGLARFREQVRHGRGHDMAICNNNSLGRLIDTIERLRAERDAALSATPSQRLDAATVERCAIGSCHRHGKCMYMPCRAAGEARS